MDGKTVNTITIKLVGMEDGDKVALKAAVTTKSGDTFSGSDSSKSGFTVSNVSNNKCTLTFSNDITTA